VLVGSPADRIACAEIARAVIEEAGETAVSRLRDLSGQTTLAELAGVMAAAAAVVSNDSGAMHLAGAVGTPVVAVFGATNERRTSPLTSGPEAVPPAIVATDVWCRPCMLRECPIDHRCMTRIPAARVFDSIRQVAR
jgi:heptosyltransferase-2